MNALADIITDLLAQEGINGRKHRAEIWSKVIEEAYELPPIRNVRKNGSVVSMEVKSRSDPSAWRAVVIDGITHSCTCPAGMCGRTCWHVRWAWKVIRLLEGTGLLRDSSTDGGGSK